MEEIIIISLLGEIINNSVPTYTKHVGETEECKVHNLVFCLWWGLFRFGWFVYFCVCLLFCFGCLFLLFSPYESEEQLLAWAICTSFKRM